MRFGQLMFKLSRRARAKRLELRRSGNAKRKEYSAKKAEPTEHSAKGKAFDFFSHWVSLLVFLALCPLLFAPCYFMTLSALASTFGGIVRPIWFAVLKLMMNSNFVGCSTGRSAGFLPFRILSTYVAARRNRSAKFTP
jgi:hypothetical protein